MNFDIPILWGEPRGHSTDCYYCVTNISGINSKSKHMVSYPNLPSPMKPVPAEEVILSDVDEEGSVENEDDSIDPTFEVSCSSSKPHLLPQGDLNDLVGDLQLSKRQGELLGNRLKGWNLLHKYTKVCVFRNVHSDFKNFFSAEDRFVFCNDVHSLMDALGHEHKADELGLFID